jgi:hypothetical protein
LGEENATRIFHGINRGTANKPNQDDYKTPTQSSSQKTSSHLNTTYNFPKTYKKKRLQNLLPLTYEIIGVLKTAAIELK